jgi:hypothetical protein
LPLCRLQFSSVCLAADLKTLACHPSQWNWRHSAAQSTGSKAKRNSFAMSANVV